MAPPCRAPRVGRFRCAGETVVDLYAGIGYYVVPYLVHAGAARVVACEWNEDSLLALRENLVDNGVAHRCEVLAGDNRETTRGLVGLAHRVNLGLLPSSEEGWPIAVRALREEGGWLHVHGNVLDEAREAWVERVRATITELARCEGRVWEVQCKHLERVKSYAPHVSHYVADIWCQPPGDDDDSSN
jgi:tRNA G37 N-methylase Trm5